MQGSGFWALGFRVLGLGLRVKALRVCMGCTGIWNPIEQNNMDKNMGNQMAPGVKFPTVVGDTASVLISLCIR